jgi:MYXO-CTERM domain-containing protein
MRNSSFVSGSALAATFALFASTASAHIELIDPEPRYVLPANKSCPCGDGDSNRKCDQTAEESTDPNRSDKVTTFEAGSTITVVADEYVDHAGRMRVAFDPDGADLADFNANVLHDEADFAESGLTKANPHVWKFEIELPETPCDNCTLQVIQVMQGGTEKAVADPAPLSTYYSCADIRLVAPGTLGDSESSDDDQTGAAGSAVASGGAGGGSGNTAGRGGAAGTTAEAASDDDSADGEGSSCSFAPSRAATSPGARAVWGLAPLALLAAARWRRRQRADAR